MAAQFFSDDDCLTTQEWDVLWDSIDSNGKGVGWGVGRGGGASGGVETGEKAKRIEEKRK